MAQRKKAYRAMPRMAWLFFDNLFVKGCGTGSACQLGEQLKQGNLKAEES